MCCWRICLTACSRCLVCSRSESLLVCWKLLGILLQYALHGQQRAENICRKIRFSRWSAVVGNMGLSFSCVIPTPLVITGCRLWKSLVHYNTSNTNHKCMQDVECPFRATTNDYTPYPRPVRPRVVPIASTQTLSISHTSPAGCPPCRCRLVSLVTFTNSNHDFTKKSKLRIALE